MFKQAALDTKLVIVIFTMAVIFTLAVQGRHLLNVSAPGKII